MTAIKIRVMVVFICLLITIKFFNTNAALDMHAVYQDYALLFLWAIRD